MTIKELVDLARSQGYVTYLDFKKCIPKEIIDKEQLNDIVCMLKETGIEIKMEKAEVINLFKNDG